MNNMIYKVKQYARKVSIKKVGIILSLCNILLSNDTFSIVAVDTLTGQVGSAGASCIQGSIIISDIHPGLGAIHTQSYWNASNQDSASSLMEQGYEPQDIIDWLLKMMHRMIHYKTIWHCRSFRRWKKRCFYGRKLF